MRVVEVKVRGPIKDLGSKDGRKFELKMEITPDKILLPDLYDLQEHGDVEAVLRMAPALPKDRTAEVSGQTKMFTDDGKPRRMVLCGRCGYETAHKAYDGAPAEAADGRKGTLYECEICHGLDLVEDSAPAADIVNKSADQPEAAGEATQPVGAEQVSCPKCDAKMRFEPDNNSWVCTNDQCQKVLHEEVRRYGPVPCPACYGPMDYDVERDEWFCRTANAQHCPRTIPGADIRATAAEKKAEPEPASDIILICPKCGQHELVRGDDGETWECSGADCGHWITEDEAQRLIEEQKAAGEAAAEGDQAADESDDPPVLDTLAGWRCPKCGGEIRQAESNSGPVLKCRGCGYWMTEIEAKAKLQRRRWWDPKTGKVYEVTTGIGEPKQWGLYERAASGSHHRVKAKALEPVADRAVAEERAAEYAKRHGWVEEAGDEPDTFRPAAGE